MGVLGEQKINGAAKETRTQKMTGRLRRPEPMQRPRVRGGDRSLEPVDPTMRFRLYSVSVGACVNHAVGRCVCASDKFEVWRARDN
ncbi:hypothetical protein EVAR_2361_1 [Eumeta japonica]|uniref:Uncharacterized protein n=1 Tax=Eumeta variegata TaxID=151549 RepID=A0A4C1SG21_EUMVA|nr:hypothetical protein EVAR_2361_1 [Eumeta japonica]